MSDSKRAARLAWTPEQERIIRENYGHLSVRELAALTGRSEKAIYNYVSREGITAREYREWTAGDLAELAGMYEHMTVPQIAAVLGRSEDSVRQRVIRLHTGKRAAGEAQIKEMLAGLRAAGRDPSAGFPHADAPMQPPLAYPADCPVARKTFITRATVHDYFSDVTTWEQGYALGLMAADGNVASGRHPRVSVGLVTPDMRAVEFVRDRINPAAPLSMLADGRAVVQVTSRQMVTDLARIGIVPRKSSVLSWPEHLGELQRPFLLGYFDGDGSGFLARDRYGRELPGWNACSGSRRFLVAMRDYIREATGVKLQKIQKRKDKDLWQVSVTGLGAVLLDEWLHQEGVGLARKRFPEHALAYYRT